MRNEEGPAVDSRCGVLRIAWFGVTWKQKKIKVGEKGNGMVFESTKKRKKQTIYIYIIVYLSSSIRLN